MFIASVGKHVFVDDIKLSPEPKGILLIWKASVPGLGLFPAPHTVQGTSQAFSTFFWVELAEVTFKSASTQVRRQKSTSKIQM